MVVGKVLTPFSLFSFFHLGVCSKFIMRQISPARPRVLFLPSFCCNRMFSYEYIVFHCCLSLSVCSRVSARSSPYTGVDHPTVHMYVRLHALPCRLPLHLPHLVEHGANGRSLCRLCIPAPLHERLPACWPVAIDGEDGAASLIAHEAHHRGETVSIGLAVLTRWRSACRELPQ
jgi:hypothetical protein